ncbi:thioredoxin family protein [Desulfovibrio ferrophilus]|uniref:Redox-active disulfide protein 2 n=1 Tax=Desulfovibrio ferrophilus TaxID=241368 RepID=A0A2Z6B2X3_9BACT|nr:thioredoxin family protein [Desulfovibrio ferrophilus]BBD09884.1 redox-active disulfide protein 2 [Desulfovibrio ferrophilus]
MKEIKVLGPGCPKCEQLKKNVEQAVAASGVECNIEKITDMLKMSEYGIMITPALVVDGEVKSVGKLLSPDDIAEFLK